MKRKKDRSRANTPSPQLRGRGTRTRWNVIPTARFFGHEGRKRTIRRQDHNATSF